MRFTLLSACAALTLALATWISPAVAADPPKIRIVPSADPAAAVLDHKLPASGEFTMEVRLGDLRLDPTSDASGTLWVWPKVEQACAVAAIPPVPAGGPLITGVPTDPQLVAMKQGHKLAMSLGGTDKDHTLDATVPALQVGQEFCFHIDVSSSVGKEVLGAAARAASQRIAAWFQFGAGDCTNQAKLNVLFTWALWNALRPLIPVPDVSRAAALAVDAYLAAGAGKCEDLVKENAAIAALPAAAPVAMKQAAVKAHDDAFDALVAALTPIFSGDGARMQLSVVAGRVDATSTAGSAMTPNKNNYASPDFGVMLALPSGGLAHDVWVLPYVGLNIYFIPVDRSIRLSQLTGTTGEQFRQHFSFTLGTTLWAPPLSGRVVNRPIGIGNYPLLAAGWRLSQYTRVVGGVVFYDLSDKNPASAGHTIWAAPSLGASIDADIITLLTTLWK